MAEAVEELEARVMKRRGVLMLAGAASAWLVLPPAARAASKPTPTPEQVIHNLGFAQSDVGYILFDVQSKRVLVEQNADQLFLPASVSKLPTVYAALEILGPDHRFATTLYRRGSDIYLKGGGDPSLASTDLQALAAQLRAAPLEDVSTGSAASRFFYDDSLMVSLPEITARQPVAVAYNTGISALDVDFNRVEVDWQLRPNGRFDFRALCIADGMILPADWITFAPASPEVWADTPFLYAGDSTLDRWQYARTLADHGSTFLPVKATAAHTALLFRTLAKAGGVALPLPGPGQVPADAVQIGGIESRPLAEIIIGLLRFSNNPSAELVGLAASRKLTDDLLTLGPSAAALTRLAEGARAEGELGGLPSREPLRPQPGQPGHPPPDGAAPDACRRGRCSDAGHPRAHRRRKGDPRR